MNQRIVVIGCGGSGKTHLADQLATLPSLPVTHLDALFYDSDWNPRPAGEFEAAQGRLVAGSRWLIEGNYAATSPIRLAAADTVIFLDLPAVTSLLGVLQRRWRVYTGAGAMTSAVGELPFRSAVAQRRSTATPRL